MRLVQPIVALVASAEVLCQCAFAPAVHATVAPRAHNLPIVTADDPQATAFEAAHATKQRNDETPPPRSIRKRNAMARLKAPKLRNATAASR